MTYESKALELVQNALFWCLGNFMSESKGNGRYWTYKRQLCCAFSETQETSKQTNAGEKELKKNTNQKKKKKVNMETTLLTLEYSGHTICGMIIFILLSVSLCV